jgi:glycosyltransferase involved in cell wall biosynthesis
VEVVHLTTFARGGAALAATRLHLRLRRDGVQSTLFVGEGSERAGMGIRQLRPPTKRIGMLARKLRAAALRLRLRYASRRARQPWQFSMLATPLGRAVLPALHGADVVHLHWIPGTLDPRLLPVVAPGAALVWTFHDLNPFTGGCHYPATCERHVIGCGVCPALGSTRARDLSRLIWSSKRRVVTSPGVRDRMVVVCPSRWLATHARNSPVLAGVRIEAIPNGVDLAEFSPVSRESSRQVLGLPLDRTIALFTAHDVADSRKGFDLLTAALQSSRATGLDLMTISAGSHGEWTDALPDHVNFGFVESPRLLATLYSAADLVVIPSREDNLPNVGIEASACGIPVLAFAVGGIPELIEDGHTGFLVRDVDADALAATLRVACPDRTRLHALGAAARSKAEREFDVAVQSRRYQELYSAIMFPARS